MTYLAVPILRVSAPLPAGVVIAASDLTASLAASDMMTQARQQAQAEAEGILRQAQEQADTLQQQCDDARASAWQEGVARFEQEIPAMRQQAVADTIEWLVAEHELECDIADRLERQLRDIMTQVFEEFYGQQSGASVLVSRLRAQINTLLKQEVGTLSVCEAQFDELRQAFVTHPQLRIQPDPRLQPGEALLDTPLVSLHLNLEEQLGAILHRLQQMSREKSDGQSD